MKNESILNVTSLTIHDSNYDEIIVKNRERLIDEYNSLIKNQLIVVDFLINNNVMKSLTLYNLLYCVEISLKFLMISITLDEKAFLIGNHYGHNIPYLIDDLISSDVKIFHIDKLKFILSKFKNEGKKLQLQDYANYKYNYSKDSNIVIFEDNTMSDTDIKNVREVIEWVRSHISI